MMPFYQIEIEHFVHVVLHWNGIEFRVTSM